MSKERLEAVQTLRAFASVIVAYGHICSSTLKMSERHGFEFPRLYQPTGVGVDIFFVISGFIMVFASQRLFTRDGAALEFLCRRIVRIVPMYWLATGVFILMLAVDAWRGGLFPPPTAIFQSLFFIPSASFKPVDGHPYPILSAGWTLNFEFFFYVLFALFLFLRQGRAVLAVTAGLAGLVVAAAVLQPQSTALRFWSQPIVLEFAAGMGIAVLRRRKFVLPGWLRIALAFAAVAWVLLASEVNDYDLNRLMMWGLPSALLMAAIVLGPDPVPERFERAAATVGDASYSLYLVHPLIVVAVQHSGIHPWSLASAWLYVFVMLVLSCGAAIVVTRRVERPLLKYLNTLAAPIYARRQVGLV